jgi:hypothetical protein
MIQDGNFAIVGRHGREQENAPYYATALFDRAAIAAPIG